MENKIHDLGDRTFEFARDIVNVCLYLPPHPGVGWVISQQLVRSATFVGVHVIESRMSSSRADFIFRTSLARKNVHTTIFWLRLINATQISDNPLLAGLLTEAKQLQKILTGLSKTTQSS